MPTFRFRGFPTSSAVALSVAQGAAAENASVASWGTQSPMSLDVSATFTESDDSGVVISPGAVWLTVTGWSGWDSPGPSGTPVDPRLHDIEYYWTITGPGDFTPRSEVNLPSSPTAFRNMGIQRGPFVVFPLSAAGEYTWTCFAVEPASGKTHTEQGTFTTISEATAYPGARTICYSIADNFTGKPTGALEVSTLVAMRTAITNAITAGSTFRICLRRGETYAGTNIDFREQWTASFPNFRTSTYGTGADPIIAAPFATSDQGLLFRCPAGGGSKHAWFGPMHWRGRWDTVNDRGYLDNGRPWDNDNGQGTITAYGVRMTGTTQLADLPKNDNAYTAFINCDLSDWKNYGFMSEDGKDPLMSLARNRNFALIGTRLSTVPNHVHQWVGREGAGEWDAQLCNGGGSATGWLMRVIGYSALIMQHCSTHSSFGVLSGSPASQRHFRLNNKTSANPHSIPGMWVNVAYNVHEGTAAGAVWDLAGNDYYNAIFDSCIFLPSGLNSSGAQIGANNVLGGLTVRNCYLFSGFSTEVQSQGSILVGGTNDGTPPGPVSIYNSTNFNARDTSVNYVRNLSRFTQVTEENNFFQRFGTDTGFDIMEQIAGLSLAFRGIRRGFRVIQHTLTGVWTNGGTFEVSYANPALSEQDETPTNLAYWQGLPSTDNHHAMKVGDNDPMFALNNAFAVSFSSTSVVFTNNTGADVGANGVVVAIRLDRASQLPAPDTRYAPNAVGSVVWCRIADFDKASFEATMGVISDRDIFDVRRKTPAYRGAVEV